jgi:glycosyltransferase involved in cell wall biosynthesis
MSFDLVETGGIAWRLGRYLGIPASGWGFGEDVRYPRSSPLGEVVKRAIQNLNCVFYQSEELKAIGKDLLGDAMTREIALRQRVLPHGIPSPPVLERQEVRKRIREELGISETEILVLNVSRVTRPKGVFELLEAFELAAAKDPLMRCVWVGAKSGFDESLIVQERIRASPLLKEKVKLLSACSPDQVWEYLCAADIFAFPSHREGMSNSLLEAMAMKLPAVAFAIPPNCEIDQGAGVLMMAPPFDVQLFSEHLIYLSSSSEARMRLGKSGAAIVEDRFQVSRNMECALRGLADVTPNRH